MTLIKGGTVFDGTSEPGKKNDILIDGEVIAAIGQDLPGDGCQTFDATGLNICPGFIDIHGHSELEILRDPLMKAKVNQGITTEVSGNCGIGVFPIRDVRTMPKGLLTEILGPWEDFSWNDYSSYRSFLFEKNSPYSLLMLQSHSMLRFSAMEGNPNRPASDSEILAMVRMLEKSMDQGCLGLSTGLYYAPCIYASDKELQMLAETVARNDGILAVHHRCEGTDIRSSLKQIITIAEKAKVRLEISHLKIIGMKNQGLLDEVFSIIENAETEIGFDQYPYDFGSTSLNSLLPPDILSLDESAQKQALKNPSTRKKVVSKMKNPLGWDSITDLAGMDNIRISYLAHFPQYLGMSLEEIAKAHDKDPYDSLLDILSEETGPAMMIDVTETRETLKRIFLHPLGCFGTDALYTASNGHPRSYGAAPHVLSKSFLDEMGTTTEFAINRMTGKTATRLRLNDRGFIRKGLRADIVIYNPSVICDTATMTKAASNPIGIKAVFIAGCNQELG